MIFIGGTGRCGTTILKRAMGMSPFVSALGRELHVHIRKGCLLEAIQRGSPLTDEEIEAARNRYRKADVRSIPSLVAGNEKLKETGDGSAAMHELIRRAFRSNIVPVEDTPDNMWHAKKLVDLLPRARFIHMVRNPVRVLESVQASHWSKPTYNETSQYLAKSYQRCLENEEAIGTRCLRIRLEDLSSHRESTMASISDFLGVDISHGSGLIKPGAESSRSVSESARVAFREHLSVFAERLGYDA